MKPSLRRVEIPSSDIPAALERLADTWELPDGCEAVDRRAQESYYKQISAGFYYQLVFPYTTTREAAMQWYSDAAEILEWHRLGVL